MKLIFSMKVQKWLMLEFECMIETKMTAKAASNFEDDEMVFQKHVQNT